MAFREYNYGDFRTEIRKLLRRRLMIKERIRYHRVKAEDWETELPKVEAELDKYLKRAQGKY
jgi:hypothetical protein